MRSAGACRPRYSSRIHSGPPAGRPWRSEMPGEPAKLRLHVPEPTGRPGQATDFSYLRVSAAGVVPRPAVDIVPSHTGTMAWKLIRVLDDAGRAVGPCLLYTSPSPR